MQLHDVLHEYIINENVAAFANALYYLAMTLSIYMFRSRGPLLVWWLSRYSLGLIRMLILYRRNNFSQILPMVWPTRHETLASKSS